jgi:RNA ligase (TIGR02306 family)
MKKILIEEGLDLTLLLNIKKFDPQALIEERLAAEQAAREKSRIKKFLGRYSWFRRMFGKQRGGFPKFIHKTDEDRIQLFPHICEEHSQTKFEVTEKLDGQSGTWFLVRHKFLFWNKYSFGVCSRKLLLNRPDNSSYWEIAKKYNIEKVLKNLIGDYAFVAIQGEICGPGIQDNKYNLPERDMWAFNLVYPDGMRDNFVAACTLEGEGLKFVPGLADPFYLYPSIEGMLIYSNGKSRLNEDTLREGIVIRNYEKGISFKVVSPEFLLRYKE